LSAMHHPLNATKSHKEVCYEKEMDCSIFFSLVHICGFKHGKWAG